MIPKSTDELCHSPTSAKRPSSDDSLKKEERYTKRQREHTVRDLKMRKNRYWVPLELLQKYCNVVNASEGYDVLVLPKYYYYGSINAFDIKKNNVDELKIYQGAETALIQFNHKNGTDYKFLDVVKSTHAIVRGHKFYVTFVGIARSSRRFTTFEAEVWADLESEVKVTLCRKKLSDNARETILDEQV